MPEVEKRSLARLARFCGFDHDRLASEYNDYVGIAQQCAQRDKSSSFLAWKTALGKARRNTGLRAARPQGLLRKCLARWGAWKGSTSGLEQGFARLNTLGLSDKTREAQNETETWTNKIARGYKYAERVDVGNILSATTIGLIQPNRYLLQLGFGV